MSNMYNLLVWKWIDKKFEMKWMYLLCFQFVDTAFLLCGAELFWNQEDLKALIYVQNIYLYREISEQVFNL